MIFDSEQQKNQVLEMIGKVPVTTTVHGILSGPSEELRRLMASIAQAHVISVDDQTVAMIELEKRNRGTPPVSDD